MIFKRCLILKLLGGLTIESILAMLNLTVRMVPGFTTITVDPVLTINLSVISTTKVHLVTIVALLVVFETIVAPLAELYFFT